MSVEFIVFISPPGGCPHCDRFRELYAQLPVAKQQLFDVRTGNTAQTNPLKYNIPYWPIAFPAKNRTDGKVSMMEPLDENPSDIVLRLKNTVGRDFSADTTRAAGGAGNKRVKLAALVALVAWLVFARRA
jgi:hypothetical protein